MSGSGADEPEFWWCLTHSRVEGHDGWPNKDRMGPYATAAEAERALQTAAERTEAWDRDDEDWADKGAGDPTDPKGPQGSGA